MLKVYVYWVDNIFELKWNIKLSLFACRRWDPFMIYFCLNDIFSFFHTLSVSPFSSWIESKIHQLEKTEILLKKIPIPKWLSKKALQRSLNYVFIHIRRVAEKALSTSSIYIGEESKDDNYIEKISLLNKLPTINVHVKILNEKIHCWSLNLLPRVIMTIKAKIFSHFQNIE